MPKFEYSSWPLIASLLIGFVILAASYIIAPDKLTQTLSVNPAGDKEHFPYRLDEPDKKYKLPDKLEEVSGLTYLGSKEIGCIQDEKGTIYRFDLKSEEAKKLFEFADKGDYEGVEIVEDAAYIVRSDGTIFEVPQLEEAETKDSTRIYGDFPLKGCDVEGLGWDPVFRQLLIAVKTNGKMKNRKLQNRRFIFSFDPATKSFGTKPRFVVDPKSLKRFTNELEVRFDPSGIAVHPITGNIYIIASAGNLLVVLDRMNGKALAAIHLPGKVFRQPEGICFNKKGDMYISNEAQNKRPNIMKFDYRPDRPDRPDKN